MFTLAVEFALHSISNLLCSIAKMSLFHSIPVAGMARLLPNAVRANAAMGRGGITGQPGSSMSATGGFQARPSAVSSFGGPTAASASASARGAPGPDRNITYVA